MMGFSTSLFTPEKFKGAITGHLFVKHPTIKTVEEDPPDYCWICNQKEGTWIEAEHHKLKVDPHAS